MKKVYVAGKYSSDNIIDGLKNIARGRHSASKLFELGFAPYCPWHDATFILDNPEGMYSKQMFYGASLEWMTVSDAVLVISGVGDCGGVDAEIKEAGILEIPVFYNVRDLIGWREQMNLKEVSMKNK